ncbi:hypothetical protein [Streptomyces sp. NPDC096323]|uniref:hypothetical protein n=1 Tax=Streptomyces sp. NPDC096323 TaxID=3155822 RepID=UPI0033327912
MTARLPPDAPATPPSRPSTHTVLYDPDGQLEAGLPLDREPYESLVTAVLAWTCPDTFPIRDYRQITLQLTGHVRAVAAELRLHADREGVLDDFAFDMDAADPFRLLAQAGQQVRGGMGVACGDLRQGVDYEGQAVAEAGTVFGGGPAARRSGGPAGQGVKVLGNCLMSSAGLR